MDFRSRRPGRHALAAAIVPSDQQSHLVLLMVLAPLSVASSLPAVRVDIFVVCACSSVCRHAAVRLLALRRSCRDRAR